MHGTLFLSAKHRKPLNKIFAIVSRVCVCVDKADSSPCACPELYDERSALISTAFCDLHSDPTKEILPSSLCE